MAFTATKNVPLAATTTGSWPRPAWYSQSLWGRPLDTAMLDPAYREIEMRTPIVPGGGTLVGRTALERGPVQILDAMAEIEACLDARKQRVRAGWRVGVKTATVE